jgi:X-Pro dipeptidyl-peptidase
VRSSRPAARIGALLVDYGAATVRNTADLGPGITTLGTRSCWGESTSYDSACFLDTAAELAVVDHQLIATSWADIGHWRSLQHGSPLVPGRPYTMTFSLGCLDHVVPAGHRIGLVIGGTDGFRFTAPTLHPTITVDLSGTSVTLPVAR